MIFICNLLKSDLNAQWNSAITNSVVNEYSVITNRFLGKIGYFSTQNNKQKWPVVITEFDCINETILSGEKYQLKNIIFVSKTWKKKNYKKMK